jgi:hypothetical protein
VRYLCPSNTGDAAAAWAEVERHPAGAPGIAREPLRSPSVVRDPLEAEQAIAWARAHPRWTDDPPPLYHDDPNA